MTIAYMLLSLKDPYDEMFGGLGVVMEFIVLY